MRRTELPFSPEYDFYVRRPQGVTVDGNHIAQGVKIDKTKFSARRLEMLFNSGKIEPRAPSPTALARIRQQLPQTLNDNGLRAHHKGFGKWFILDANGVEVAGPMSREEAAQRIGFVIPVAVPTVAPANEPAASAMAPTEAPAGA